MNGELKPGTICYVWDNYSKKKIKVFKEYVYGIASFSEAGEEFSCSYENYEIILLPGKCEWRHDDICSYRAQCNKKWYTIDSEPLNRGTYNYCPFCRREIKVVE